MNILAKLYKGIGMIALFACSVSSFASDYATIQLQRALAIQDTQYAITNGCIAMRIKYIGATIGSATVASASGNLTFLNSAGTAATDINAAGIVDAATYSTFGKMAAVINASTYWRCTLVAVRPSQLTGSTALTAFSATATHLQDAEGAPLYYTTSVLHMVSVAIGPEWMSNPLLKVTNDDLLNRRSTPAGNPQGATWQNELLYVTTTMTATTPSIYVYAVKDDTDGATEILLWQDLGSTGVAKTIPILPKQAPIKPPPGWRLVVQFIGTGGGSAATIQVHGLTYQVAASQ